jgi:hypothetical protein
MAPKLMDKILKNWPTYNSALGKSIDATAKNYFIMRKELAPYLETLLSHFHNTPVSNTNIEEDKEKLDTLTKLGLLENKGSYVLTKDGSEILKLYSPKYKKNEKERQKLLKHIIFDAPSF